MSFALSRSDVTKDLEALKEAAEAFAQIAAGEAAQNLQWIMSYRVGFLSEAHWEVKRPLAKSILAEDLAVIDRLEMLAALRKWFPDDEDVAGLIVGVLTSNPPFAERYNAFDTLNDCCKIAIEAGRADVAGDWLTATAVTALSPKWRDITQGRIAAGMLADNGHLDRAMPLLLQIANDITVDAENRKGAAWHIAEHDLETGAPILLDIASSAPSADGADLFSRCDTLRALFFLDAHEQVCRLAPVLWKKTDPGTEERTICETYWGRSRWALDPPTREIS
jgi:hypothetical protein